MSESASNATSFADPLAPVRYLDVVLLVLAAPFVVLLDLPVLGFAVGALVWILARFSRRRSSTPPAAATCGARSASRSGA
jgi:hypothetical protein